MPAKIVVVGSFNVDLTSFMDRMPKPGETVYGREFMIGPGGKGSNQAVAAARLGAEVTFIGRIGTDVFAPYALELWRRDGISVEYVIEDPEESTGVATIFVDETGENIIVVTLGANLSVDKSDIDQARDTIAEADVLLTQLEIDYDTVGYALRTARDLGVRTILNPAPAGQISEDILGYADILTPNETELEILSSTTGIPIEESARSLLTIKDQAIIVTLGSNGALCVLKDQNFSVPAYDVDVVDTTGAGDAFNGALAVALAEGQGIKGAIGFANAAAALCVTKPGAAQSMPTRSEVEIYLNG
jgi:ribokinase